MNPIKHLSLLALILTLASCKGKTGQNDAIDRTYSGEQLERLAFPMGGIGAGMICLDGNGSISHVSVRNKPDVYNEPFMFGAIAVKGLEHGARVLEGPLPRHKIFGGPHSGNGNSSRSYGFPRFELATFAARFPFGKVSLKDADMPLDVEIEGWSPFVPGDEDNSSLPVAALEYTFTNLTDSTLEMVFSYHSENFMRIKETNQWGATYPEKGHSIQKTPDGFMLSQACIPDKP